MKRDVSAVDISALVGGILGLLISYLFAPSFMGERPSFYEFYIKHPEFRTTIVVCTTVGIVIGIVNGLLIDGENEKKT